MAEVSIAACDLVGRSGRSGLLQIYQACLRAKQRQGAATCACAHSSVVTFIYGSLVQRRNLAMGTCGTSAHQPSPKGANEPQPITRQGFKACVQSCLTAVYSIRACWGGPVPYTIILLCTRYLEMQNFFCKCSVLRSQLNSLFCTAILGRLANLGCTLGLRIWVKLGCRGRLDCAQAGGHLSLDRLGSNWAYRLQDVWLVHRSWSVKGKPAFCSVLMTSSRPTAQVVSTP